MNTAPLTLDFRTTTRRLRLGPLEGGGVFGFFGVVVVYLALSLPRMGDMYVIDEAVFPYVADGILKHGAPFYYNGELRPADFGLWHPPLYDYLLAGFVGVFGFSPFSVRAFGLVCVLVAAFLLLFVLRRMMSKPSQLAYVVLTALVLLSPQIISGALIPDIDGSFGLIVVVLGLWLATVVKQDSLSPRMVLLIVGFATLTVATKFTISGFVALIVGTAALLSERGKLAKAIAVISGFVAGTGLALALLVLAGALIGFDARLPFDYLFTSLGARTPGRGGLAGAIATLLDGPGSTLVWVGPMIMVAAVVATILVAARKPHGVDARLVALMTGAGLIIIIGYAFISANPFQFPKYTPVAVPAFALAATTLVVFIPEHVLTSLRTARGRWVLGIYSAILLIGILGMFVILRRDERVHPRALGDLALLSVGCFLVVLIVTIVGLLMLRGRPAEGEEPPHARSLVGAGLIIALLATPMMTQASAAAVNAVAPYSTRYYYGERGMNQFVEQAKQYVAEGTPIIGPKDVGFQMDRPFYEDALLFAESVDEFREFVVAEKVPYVVTRDTHDYSESVYPEYFAVIREFYEPVIVNPDSDFVLWKLKAAS